MAPQNTHTHPSLNTSTERVWVAKREVAPITNTAAVTLAAGHGCTASPGNTQPGQGATRGWNQRELLAQTRQAPSHELSFL